MAVKSKVNVYVFTFLTVFSFVSRIAGTRAHDANPTTPTLRVNALGGRHITLCTFPTTVTETASFGILSVSTAQYWAGCCEIKHDRRLNAILFNQALEAKEHLDNKLYFSFFSLLL